MDYRTHGLQNQDISNLSSSSAHRMPTVSAAQALQNLTSSSSQRNIPTGLPALDAALSSPSLQASDDASDSTIGRGGVVRGQVTEVFGPPGVGKTALGIQLVVSALRAGQGVVWVDTAHPLPGPRLKEILSSSRHFHETTNTSSPPADTRSITELLGNLTCFTTPTLPHLIALLCHAPPTFPTQGTSLIIVDSLSTLIANAYPRTLEHSSTPGKPGPTSKHGPQQWAAARKWSVLQFFISSLQKLATLRNIAIVILSQTVTKMRFGSGAILVPAITSKAWDAGIATSIMLFRDWGVEARQLRFAKLLKADGVLVGSSGEGGKVIGFTIESHGLEEIHIPNAAGIIDSTIIITPSRKRKADEIRDSEDEDDLEGSDEDYGWAEEDDRELPAPPPQWQGSEDILVRGVTNRAEEDDDDGEDGEDGERVEQLTPDATESNAEGRQLLNMATKAMQ